MPEYTREQLWKIFDKLPEDLQEAVFSMDTALNIYDICVKNEVDDDRISEIAKYAGYVLMGVLLPEDFQSVLEKDVKLKKDLAKNIAHDINRLIFFPVKESLVAIHEIKPAKPAGSAPGKMPEIPFAEAEPRHITRHIKEKPEGPDIYREAME